MNENRTYLLITILVINILGMVYLYLYAIPEIAILSNTSKQIACFKYFELLSHILWFLLVLALFPILHLSYFFTKIYLNIKLPFYSSLLNATTTKNEILLNIALVILILCLITLIYYGMESFNCYDLNPDESFNLIAARN